MLEELVSILAFGVAAATLFVPRNRIRARFDANDDSESTGSRRRCSLALRDERTRKRR